MRTLLLALSPDYHEISKVFDPSTGEMTASGIAFFAGMAIVAIGASIAVIRLSRHADRAIKGDEKDPK